MAKQKTTRELETQAALTKLNESLGWFCVGEDYECKTITLKADWYYITGTGETPNGNWIRTVKSRTTGEFYRLSDVDYQKIITKFKNRNKHLN
jgi:hypothetical protein